MLFVKGIKMTGFEFSNSASGFLSVPVLHSAAFAVNNGDYANNKKKNINGDNVVVINGDEEYMKAVLASYKHKWIERTKHQLGNQLNIFIIINYSLITNKLHKISKQ